MKISKSHVFILTISCSAGLLVLECQQTVFTPHNGTSPLSPPTLTHNPTSPQTNYIYSFISLTTNKDEKVYHVCYYLTVCLHDKTSDTKVKHTVHAQASRFWQTDRRSKRMPLTPLDSCPALYPVTGPTCPNSAAASDEADAGGMSTHGLAPCSHHFALLMRGEGDRVEEVEQEPCFKEGWWEQEGLHYFGQQAS